MSLMTQMEGQMAGTHQLPTNSSDLSFPAATKQAAGVVGGVQTDVMSVWFADKILFTITQKGRLGQWLHVPLENSNPGMDEFTFAEVGDDNLLPPARLTATSILGGRTAEWEPIGHLYACQIASAIVTKTPTENRLLVVGLGLEQPTTDREIFYGIVDLVLQCI
ncbi:hypothetical protein VTO42DRAFT_222 [Malbranchea cinnamomea]